MASQSNKTKTNNDSVGPTVFMPQKHPELHEIGIKPIQTFLQRREQYLLKADDAAAQGSTFVPVSLVNSVEFKLLEALIAFDTFRGVSDVSELTDDILLAWLKQQIEQSASVITPVVLEADLKKRVKLDFKEADPKMRFMNLFMKSFTFLEERNLSDLIDTNPKTAVKHICSLLRPLCFQQKIENDLALDKAHLRKDWKGFYQHVIQNVVSFEAFYASMLQAANRSSQSSSTIPPRASSSEKQNSHGNAPREPQSKSQKSYKAQLKTSESSDSIVVKNYIANARPNVSFENVNSATSQLPLCLNEEACSGDRHYIRDCKKTPEDKKRQLLAERRQKRKQTPSSLKHVGVSSETTKNGVPSAPKVGNGRIAATLSDCLLVTVSEDYGSDHAALSEHHISRLAEANIVIPVLLLQNPVCMHLAVEDSKNPLIIYAERKARISTTLSTTVGDFRLRNVEYLVFKEPMNEVLLSGPLLQSLGFNLDDHLARVRRQFEGVDCSNIVFEANTELAATMSDPDSKLSRLLYADISNEAAFLQDNDDEESPVTALNTSEATLCTPKNSIMDVRTHTDADIQPHLERMYNEALQNGLPVKLGPRLRQLLHGHIDIFRIKLGSDPPLKVPPISIRLIPGASPVREKLPRY